MRRTELTRIGVVDLGTLSLRFDVFELSDLFAPPTTLLKHRATPRLGDDLYQTGSISTAKQRDLLEEFRKIQSIAREVGVQQIIALGTSALRDDPQSSLLVEKIATETGISLRLISGEEEAELTALGILTYEQLPEGNPALVDIGGGSTEITFCKGKQAISFHSFQVGASRILQQFGEQLGEHRLLPTKNVEAVKLFLQKEFERLTEFTNEIGIDFLVSSSGAARALERLVPEPTSERLKISGEQLQQLIDRLIGKTPDQLLQIPGMEPSRLDVILPGALALWTVLELLGGKFITLSAFSLRHGALVSLLSSSEEC